MNILLVGNYPHPWQESMQRFAEVLRARLSAEGHHVRLLRPSPLLGRLAPSGMGVGKWLGYMDRYGPFIFQLRAAARWADE